MSETRTAYTLHPTDVTMAEAMAGTARVVTCPECGQLEVWTEEEIIDHGMCRSIGTCPVCDPIGAQIRQAREALGLSQAKLGARLGVHPNTIARWERGELRVDHPEMVRLALERLGDEE